MLDANTILLDRYRIVRLIGQGGMGAVYEAVDERLGNTVALKRTLVMGGRLGKAFEREARLLAGLRHRSLPKVYDHFGDESGQYLVMEYIPGDDLAAILRARGVPFAVEEVLEWGDQLLRALEYLHTLRPPVLHRDIKPQNLKFSAEGALVLLDFGLAKGDPATQSLVTGSGSVFGYTPHYAPIEQIHNSGTDARSDLYAAAATLHHLLTGAMPVDALTRATAVLRRQADPLLSPTDLNPRVPPEVSHVLMRALSLNQEERPASAAEMWAALAVAREEPAATVEAPEPIPPPPSPARSLESHAPARPSPSGGWRAAASAALPLPLARALSRPWAVPIGATLALLLLVLALTAGGGATLGTTARPTSGAPALAEPREGVTEAPAPAEGLEPSPTVARPSALASSGVPAPLVTIPATADLIEPSEAYAGNLPVAVTVRGDRLDTVRDFRLVAGSGATIVPNVRAATAGEALLVITELAGPLNGEQVFELVLDGATQPVTVVLRDFRERRQMLGVREEYSYTGRVGVDESGPLTEMLVDPDAASAPAAVLRPGDEVDLLRDDVAGWYQVRLRIASASSQTSVVGWVERWLVDNEGAPAAPSFQGMLLNVSTDRAVQCGKEFRSSVYGSVERADGSGIGGALVRVSTADGRNRFVESTKGNGTYNIGGLGCTTWVVELLEVPGIAGFRANAIRVTLNGGLYTSGAVRFRQAAGS